MLQGNNTLCKLTDAQGTKEYKIGDIEKYGFTGGKVYTTGIVKHTFVEALVEGQLSIYKENDYLFHFKSISKNITYSLNNRGLSNGIEGVNLRDNGKWKNYLNFLVSDCGKKLDANRINFTQNNLTKFVKEYNTCVNSDFQENNITLPSTTFHFMGVLGVANGRSNIHANKYSSYMKAGPFGGLLLEFSKPRLSEKISLNIGFLLERNQFKGEILQITLLGNLEDKTDYNYLNLEFPVVVNFQLATKPKISFLGGMQYERMISNFNRQVIRDLLLASNYSDKTDLIPLYHEEFKNSFTIPKEQFGYQFGVRVDKIIKGEKIGILIKYKSSDSLSKFTVGADPEIDWNWKLPYHNLNKILQVAVTYTF
jgi:hypothetical protein